MEEVFEKNWKFDSHDDTFFFGSTGGIRCY